MANSKTIEIRVDRQYGHMRAFPANETGKLFAEISGRKTLTKEVLEAAMELGYQIKTVTLDVSTEEVLSELKAAGESIRR